MAEERFAPTETNTYTLNAGDSHTWERRVKRVIVGLGRLTVSDGDKSRVLKGGDEYEASDSTVVGVFANEGTNFAVEFSENSISPVQITTQPERPDTEGVDKPKRRGTKK